MSGAKNCPETPRQKMIGMMYLVLTAMLALNVAAEIINGYKMVNGSLADSIFTTDSRIAGLLANMEDMNTLNPEKTGPWLAKSKDVKKECDAMYDYLEAFKLDIIKAADKGDFDEQYKKCNSDLNRYELKKPDALDAGGEVAQLTNYEANKSGRGAELQKKIQEFRKYVENQFENKPDKVKIYEIMFKTDKMLSSHGNGKDSVDWVQGTFESMPAVAVVTMITKYQSDVRFAEESMIQYFRAKTDAGDMRVNKIMARLIPDSKVVMQGGRYHAEIALMAIDTTQKPEYFVNGAKVEGGVIDIAAGAIGDRKISGEIVVTNAEGERTSYPFEDEFSVSPPNATIANEEMNVVYRGYANQMQIAVPGISSTKLSVSANGASFTRSGDIWICNVPLSSNAQTITINVTANNGGKTQSMGSKEFRVRTLPDPKAFLKLANGDLFTAEKGGIKKSQFEGASIVAEYGASESLKANFTVKSFTLLLGDGRGGTIPVLSDGNKFSAQQIDKIKKLKSGSTIAIGSVQYTGAKSGKNLPFAPLLLK